VAAAEAMAMRRCRYGPIVEADTFELWPCEMWGIQKPH
jgi:hypothetical protein